MSITRRPVRKPPMAPSATPGTKQRFIPYWNAACCGAGSATGSGRTTFSSSGSRTMTAATSWPRPCRTTSTTTRFSTTTSSASAISARPGRIWRSTPPTPPPGRKPGSTLCLRPKNSGACVPTSIAIRSPTPSWPRQVFRAHSITSPCATSTINVTSTCSTAGRTTTWG